MNEKTTTKDHCYRSLILDLIYKMQKDESLCDIKLVADDECIYAHKIILHAISPYFRYD